MLFFILSLLAHLYHFTLVQKDLFCLDGGLIATAGIQPILEGGQMFEDKAKWGPSL